ncbi:hypothetical protein [Nostoc sp. UHCC 0251]|uniref:hypothetical protein n=1 Tax=Nostoc sp. UHCC 0251 TaxID=3110240 RepID=UPI002B202449|nr:hypothetical protein [Nostoc sp. UHCC 0251]MEA5623315.1 hypothetical protein [Nostoc sp. UHCC 0251]
MKIPFFFADTKRSFLIQKIMDIYGKEGRRHYSTAVASPRSRSVSQRTSAEVRGLQYCLGFFSIREAAPIQLLLIEKLSVLENLAAEAADIINNLVGLNAVNLQPALNEVFHVRS